MLICLAVAVCIAAGCANQSVPGENESIATAAERVSPIGIDRMIPLRVMRMYQPTLGTPTDTQLWDGLRMNVLAANDAFRPAGVQFYIKSIESCAVSNIFSSIATNPEIAYADAEQDLRCAFPALSNPLPSPTSKKPKMWWLNWAAYQYQDPREVIVWIHQLQDANYGILPWAGAAQVHLIASNVASTGTRRWLLAHELGHTVGGLSHTNDWNGVVAKPYLRNPVTGSPFKMSDMWDLMYVRNSNPPTCFASFSAASQAEQSGSTLWEIHADSNPSPTVDACGCPSVTLSGVQYLTGHACVKGLGVQTALACTPYSCGVNAMSFLNAADDWNQFFSDAQAQMIRHHLRYEVMQTEDFSGHLGQPARRPLLGYTENRQPTDVLDFNGDSRRDIAYWLPPTSTSAQGLFVIYLSPSFATPIFAGFGALGDIPVLADMDGDGRTNVAMFRPGGGSGSIPTSPWNTDGYWRWCTSPNPPTSAMCTSGNVSEHQFGLRGDVPFSGLDFDGSPSTAEMAGYRPGRWLWQQVYPTVGAVVEKQLPGDWTPQMLVPGLYDDDGATDLVGYYPMSAVFRMRLSSSSWNTDVWRYFPNSLVPTDFAGSTAQERSGAVVVRGMTYHRYVNYLFRPRLALSVYDPEAGNWYVNWAPVTQANPAAACQWGTKYDIPLGGVFSTWQNRASARWSGYSVFRSTDFNAGRTIFRDSNSTCGSGTIYDFAHTFANPRSVVSVVRDMTGDTLPELLIADPDTLQLRVLTSESNYQNSNYGLSTIPTIQPYSHVAVLL